MTKQTYAEKLRDPRWQKKRLEVLRRDQYTCQNCGETSKTLHVHHRLYSKGKNPWEYDERVFLTLCCDCHIEWEQAKEKIDLALLEIDPRSFLQVCADHNDEGAMFLTNQLAYAVARSMYMQEHESKCLQYERANAAEARLKKKDAP